VDGGSVTVQAPTRPRLRASLGGGGRENDETADDLHDEWDAARRTWTVRRVPAGDFALRVEFDTPLSIPARADPDVVPPFKGWLKALPATGSALATDRFLDGFDELTVVGTPIRRMARQSASSATSPWTSSVSAPALRQAVSVSWASFRLLV